MTLFSLMRQSNSLRAMMNFDKDLAVEAVKLSMGMP